MMAEHFVVFIALTSVVAFAVVVISLNKMQNDHTDKMNNMHY